MRIHLKPANTGNIASLVVTIIAEVAIRAGARNWKYVNPSSSCGASAPRSISEPTPNPMPSRYSSGCTNAPITFDFQIVRYSRNWLSHMRTAAGVVKRCVEIVRAIVSPPVCVR